MSHVWMRAPGNEGVSAGARIVAKGALEGILEHCKAEPGDRERALALNSELAGQGMRVIAVAGRFADAGDPANAGATGMTGSVARTSAGFRGVREDDESDLVLYGLLGFRDPLRPEVPAAVDECQTAGVKLKLITGDHALDGSRRGGGRRHRP